MQRYEHAAAGDLLHLDIKRLVRIARPSHRVTGDRGDTVKGIGAEYVHVAIDDHSRIAFSALYPDETRASMLHFLNAALAYYARLGIRFKAVLTDNGTSYRSYAFADACKQLGLKHRRTRPYTPRTNGKAERLYPDRASRMGLRPLLQQLSRARAEPGCMDPSVQVASTPC